MIHDERGIRRKYLGGVEGERMRREMIGTQVKGKTGMKGMVELRMKRCVDYEGGGGEM